MNAAARLAHQNILTRQLVLTYRLSKNQMMLFILSLFVVMSALGIVYVTHVTRLIHANYQQQLTEQNKLYMQNSQLLLERSTLMMQSKVERIAEQDLGMMVPNNKAVVIIHE